MKDLFDKRGRRIGRKVAAPAEVASGPDGEPGWVIVAARLKGSWQQLAVEIPARLVRLQKVANLDIDRLQQDESALDEALAEVESAGAAITAQYDLISKLILSWNWIDEETGQPLPQPDSAQVIAELYNDQIRWLADQMQDAFRLWPTEGNPPSGADLLPG